MVIKNLSWIPGWNVVGIIIYEPFLGRVISLDTKKEKINKFIKIIWKKPSIPVTNLLLPITLLVLSCANVNSFKSKKSRIQLINMK